MRVVNALLLLLSSALVTQAFAAKPQIRALPDQKRCVAMMPSSMENVIMMVVKETSNDMQIMMFSSAFDQLKGKEVPGEVSWNKQESVGGSFTFNGPAVTLPLDEQVFFAKAAQGKTLTVQLGKPAAQTIKFSLSDAKGMQKELDGCLALLK